MPLRNTSWKYFKLSQFSNILKYCVSCFNFLLFTSCIWNCFDLTLYWISLFPYKLYGQDQRRNSVSERNDLIGALSSQPRSTLWIEESAPGSEDCCLAPHYTVGHHLSLLRPSPLHTACS